MAGHKRDDLSPRLFALMDSLISHLHSDSEAYAFALEVLTVLNQTDACEVCNGRGSREKHKQCHHDTHDRYVLGCYDKVQCKQCHGIGRVPQSTAQVRSS